MATSIVFSLGVVIFAIQMALVAYIIAHELHVHLHWPKLSFLHHHHHDEHHLHG